MEPVVKPPNRIERRKQRTRAALITAAQGFIAAGTPYVPIQDICQAADVGVGSFYNHFETKEQLFDAAIDEALDAHGAVLDALTASIDDPAERFAFSFRLTGRMFRRPESRMVLNHGPELITAERGLAPRARRDIAVAAESGRFQVDDPTLAMAVAAGALLGLGQLVQAEPERDAAQTADRVTQDLLQMFGLSAGEARELCIRPLVIDGVDAAEVLGRQLPT